MKKKPIKILTLILAAAFALACFAGCDIISTDNRKDMAQVVAEVNIGKDKDELKSTFENAFYGETFSITNEQVDKILSTDEITKLDLVSYFINYGYSMVQSGYSYSQVFETLITQLTNRKIIIQFATLYYLNAGKVVVDAESVPGSENAEGGTVTIKDGLTAEGYLAALEEGENEALRYLLSEDNYNYALYSLRQSINSAIDSYEEVIIKAEDDDSSSSDSDRTIPTGADDEETYYYPKKEGTNEIDYQIYTGYNTAESCGEYEKLDKSNVVTRKKAYNQFIKALESNNMLDEGDDITKIEELPYFATEMKNQLEQMIINNFSDTLLISRTDAIEQSDLEAKYDEIYGGQQSIFKDLSEYTSALDSMADDNFVLYSPRSGFGFVYNILLPFSAGESDRLADYSNRLSDNTISQSEYYYYRNQLLLGLTATDQRSSWFNGSTDYSYKSEGVSGTDYYGTSGYLFFEDNAGKIDKYDGRYSYNGTVVENDDDTYTLSPAKLGIDAFISEMEGYLGFVLGSSVSGTKTSGFYDMQDYYDGNTKTYDYSKFIYYTAKINGVSSVSRDGYLVKDSVSYKALSAMNELQFAYTTDTSVLNTYFGYSVAGKGNSTDYVKEFEYAAQAALEEGAGTIMAVATDYGWHIIYVAFVFKEGATYNGFVYESRNDEGTFSNLFYNAYKDVVAQNYASTKQTELTTVLKDSAVTVYESRYKDLSSIDS